MGLLMDTIEDVGEMSGQYADSQYRAKTVRIYQRKREICNRCYASFDTVGQLQDHIFESHRFDQHQESDYLYLKINDTILARSKQKKEIAHHFSEKIISEITLHYQGDSEIKVKVRNHNQEVIYQVASSSKTVIYPHSSLGKLMGKLEVTISISGKEQLNYHIHQVENLEQLMNEVEQIFYKCQEEYIRTRNRQTINQLLRYLEEQEHRLRPFQIMYLKALHDYLLTMYIEEKEGFREVRKENYERIFNLLNDIPTLLAETVLLILKFKSKLYDHLQNKEMSSFFYPVGVFFANQYDKLVLEFKQPKVIDNQHGIYIHDLHLELIQLVHQFMANRTDEINHRVHLLRKHIDQHMIQSYMHKEPFLVFLARYFRREGNKELMAKYYGQIHEDSIYMDEIPKMN